MKNVAVFLANGFEEVEAITPIDYLRRAEITVSIIGVGEKIITGSHGITVICDTIIDSVTDDFFNSLDVLIIPGGMLGSENLHKNKKVAKLICEAMQKKILIAAICAAPIIVLMPLGILKGVAYTCYPGLEQRIQEFCSANWQKCSLGSKRLNERVVQTENILTAQGAGCAQEFSLAIIAQLAGTPTAEKIATNILAK